MDNALRHIHRNGRAINGLRQAAQILTGIMESRALGYVDVAKLTGISTQVLDRLIREHAATRPTIKAIESTFSVALPLPQVAQRYTGRMGERRDGGWGYEITCGPNNVCKSWRLGSRAKVEAHMMAVLKRLNHNDRWAF